MLICDYKMFATELSGANKNKSVEKGVNTIYTLLKIYNNNISNNNA